MKSLVTFALSLLFISINGQSYDFPKIKSNITMPIRIPLSEMSKLVNQSVKDLIYEDNSYTDNNNDQFKVKVYKTKPIRLIGGTKSNIIIEVPLKIWAEKGIGTLGIYSYQNTTFETVMYFSSTLKVNNNWTISSTTLPSGFKWITKPILDFGSLQIPITSLVEKSLKEQQTKFSSIIDEQIKTQLNLQNYASTAWNLFNAPFEISSEYKTWLKITPISVSMAPLKFYADALDTNLGIEVFSETFTGEKPSTSEPLSQLNPLIFSDKLPQSFTLQTTANIPFSEATDLARTQFLNREFEFRDGNSKVLITDIVVGNDEDRINLDITMKGSINGIAKISGIPIYDEIKQKIILKDTKFRLITSNLLYKAILPFFKGKIIRMIEDDYGIPTSEIENKAKLGMEEAFNKEYHKGLKLNGRIYELKPNELLINPSGITAIINTKAAIKLSIQGLL